MSAAKNLRIKCGVSLMMKDFAIVEGCGEPEKTVIANRLRNSGYSLLHFDFDPSLSEVSPISLFSGPTTSRPILSNHPVPHRGMDPLFSQISFLILLKNQSNGGGGGSFFNPRGQTTSENFFSEVGA
jgi:hypothetical protein